VFLPLIREIFKIEHSLGEKNPTEEEPFNTSFHAETLSLVRHRVSGYGTASDSKSSDITMEVRKLGELRYWEKRNPNNEFRMYTLAELLRDGVFFQGISCTSTEAAIILFDEFLNRCLPTKVGDK